MRVRIAAPPEHRRGRGSRTLGRGLQRGQSLFAGNLPFSRLAPGAQGGAAFRRQGDDVAQGQLKVALGGGALGPCQDGGGRGLGRQAGGGSVRIARGGQGLGGGLGEGSGETGAGWGRLIAAHLASPFSNTGRARALVRAGR
jgi:hypothetical protein